MFSFKERLILLFLFLRTFPFHIFFIRECTMDQLPGSSHVIDLEEEASEVLITYEKKNSSERVRCDACNLSILKQDLPFHQRRIHSEKDVQQCPYCMESFGLYGHLGNHIEEEHMPNGVTLWPCSVCAFETLTQDNLAFHISKCHPCTMTIQYGPIGKKKKVRCHFCSASISRGNLSAHMNRIHRGRKSHPCNLCDRSFFSLQDRRRHEERVHLISLT